MHILLDEHPPGSTNVIFAATLKVQTKRHSFRVVKQFSTAYGPQCIIWILLVHMPYFIEFARVSSIEHDEIVPTFKLRAFFRGESDDYFRFVQTPFYTVSASPYVRTRPVALVNDINAGEEQLFASGKPVYMEFGLEFDFTVSSLSRMRFANTANQNAGLDEINLAMIERFHQATDSTFTVCALDGQMSLPHCLLPMLSLQFSEHFADGATTTSVSIPFTMNIFTQVRLIG
ncbi:hypothetical protein Tcan_08013 [Toxocara canis]|uniref:Uncharacterized protein n=1 Tax=Toxocara canis TaxID=6265 RepID=A0A0B2UXU7_TOXCA|nr:hypothetical protein Tcan_08013 [Toxocara canis]